MLLYAAVPPWLPWRSSARPLAPGPLDMHQELLEFTAQAFTVQALLVPDTAHVVLYIVHPGRLVSEVLANALLALMFVDVLQAVAVAGRRR